MKTTKKLRYEVWTSTKGRNRSLGRFRALKVAKAFAQAWSFDNGKTAYLDDAINHEPLWTYNGGEGRSAW